MFFEVFFLNVVPIRAIYAIERSSTDDDMRKEGNGAQHENPEMLERIRRRCAGVIDCDADYSLKRSDMINKTTNQPTNFIPTRHVCVQVKPNPYPGSTS